MDDDDRSYYASEWRTAQAMTLTVPNFVTAARTLLSFLARVNQEPGLTQAGATLDRAVRRYDPYANTAPSRSQGSAITALY